MNTFEEQIDKRQNLNKIYTANAIRVGTFLGGPLAAGYFIAQNFKTLNQSPKAKITWLIAIAFSIILFGAALYIPAMEKGRLMVPLLYSWAVFYLVQQLQGNNLDKHLADGGTAFNWWRVIGIALLALVITFAVLTAVVMAVGD